MNRRNWLMEKVEGFLGFQKFLFVFIPFMSLIPVFAWEELGFPFPSSVGLILVLLWLICILHNLAYVLVGMQVHWRGERRAFAANLVSVLFGVLAVFALAAPWLLSSKH